MPSKINLELKHFCPDFEKVRDVLHALGARKEKEKIQKDYFFYVPTAKESASGRLKLRVEEGRQFIIYYERPEFQEGQDTASDIRLYDVHDGELLPFLQKALGVKAVVEKRREVWRIANTVFHLDTIVGVGDIFEIELQKDGEVTEEDHRIFAAYQSALLPHLGEAVAGSNVDLVLQLESAT